MPLQEALEAVTPNVTDFFASSMATNLVCIGAGNDKKTKKPRITNPGVRVQGGRIYDSENGTSCHQVSLCWTYIQQCPLAKSFWHVCPACKVRKLSCNTCKCLGRITNMLMHLKWDDRRTTAYSLRHLLIYMCMRWLSS